MSIVKVKYSKVPWSDFLSGKLFVQKANNLMYHSKAQTDIASQMEYFNFMY